MKQLAPDVWTHGIDAEGFPTLSAVILTPRRAVVVDTLTGPGEMAPVVEFLAAEAGDRRVLVVNTHHHWDHVFGNAAFAGEDIVAQRACPRLIAGGAAERRRVAAGCRRRRGSRCRTSPSATGSPTPTAGESVHFIHTPGHSEDSLVVFLVESRLLFGGDTVEWPLPNFGQRDGRDEWVRTLRQLKQLPADLVVPAHGPAMDKQIIDANERYVAGVYEAVAAAKASGGRRGELDLPAERFLAEGVVVDDVYAAAHRDNLLWAWDEV